MVSEALCISNLFLTYNPPYGTIALQGVSFAVAPQEFVAILGPSGCGKSSMLHVIAGVIPPTSGSAFCFGKSIETPGLDRGILFQNCPLFPWMTVLGNVMYPLRSKGLNKLEAKTEALIWLDQVSLKEFENFYPEQLSGGMRQRVALARIFAAQPKIFLMDEPFGSLDAHTKIQMQEKFLSIWEQHKATVLFVTHDIEEALLLSDRVLVMSARPGKIIKEIIVPLSRPRQPTDLFKKEIVSLKQHAFSLLQKQLIDS
jgi:NitT/TauT family transport system ATP-binding protein